MPSRATVRGFDIGIAGDKEVAEEGLQEISAGAGCLRSIQFHMPRTGSPWSGKPDTEAIPADRIIRQGEPFRDLITQMSPPRTEGLQ